MNDTEVIIVGAGPTGLALACELGLAGIPCRVLERRAEEPNITRAFAVNPRTLELLNARGLAEAVLAQGLPVPGAQPVPGAFLDLRDLPSRYQMLLLVPQSGTEHVLEQRARELGVEIVRGAEVVGLKQDADGVTLDVNGAEAIRASYVVGTDGAHSAVRRLIGVDFVGEQYETHIMLADVTLARAPQDRLFGAASHEGLVVFVPFGDQWYRAIVWDRTREDVPLEEPVTLAELQDAFRRIAGDDYGMGEPRWRSRFLSERRQARHYRVGRVFLAGDAAHVHSPIGGQGMNTGIGDAMNLGWKLAAAVKGWAAPDLLDSYEKERHPVGASVLRLTDALNRLVLAGSRVGLAVRQNLIRALVRVPPARRRLAQRLAGLNVSYGPTGKRMPDTGGVYEALRGGKFVLATPDAFDIQAWSDRVVPVRVEGTTTTLVRPDAYVAWQSDRASDADVRAALRQWCGDAALQRS